MKASELMIGDWVAATCKENIPPVEVFTMLPRAGRVVGIEADCIYLDFCDFGFMPQDLDPVSLTPEILEKNGFKCQGAWRIPGEDIGSRQDGDSFGLLPYFVEYTSSVFCHILYVHELQQALRLCGIDQGIVL